MRSALIPEEEELVESAAACLPTSQHDDEEKSVSRNLKQAKECKPTDEL